MSVSSLNSASDQLRRLENHLLFNEQLRTNISRAKSQLDQLEGGRCAFRFEELDTFDDAYSRRADHVLTYVTAYAAFEQFLAERMRSVLRLYERSINYQTLPTRTKNALRTGTIRLLSRLNWQRFEHLNELQIIGQYYDALANARLNLLDEALLAHDANLRAQELREILGNCGLTGAWSGVLTNPNLVSFFGNTVLQDNSVESALSFAVQRRNDAVHAVGNEIDARDVLIDVVAFFRFLINAIFDATSKEIVRFLVEHGRITKVGVSIERFRETVGIVRLEYPHTMTVGDAVLVDYGDSPRPCIIRSMQIDGVPAQYFRGTSHLEIGVDFGRRLSRVSNIYSFVDRSDADIVLI